MNEEETKKASVLEHGKKASVLEHGGTDFRDGSSNELGGNAGQTYETPELPQGTWSTRESHRVRYDLGVWYRSGRGLPFKLYETPRPDISRPGYWVGEVILGEDYRTDVLAWGPKTRRIEGFWELTALGRRPGDWLRRLLARFGVLARRPPEVTT
jgi:hypothetical protein